jgi:hypothetical protein
VASVKKAQRGSPNHSQYQEVTVQAKPQISDKSAKLAEKKRKKLLGDRENVSLVEILLIPKHNNKELEEKRKHL